MSSDEDITPETLVGITYGELTQKHPEYDAWESRYSDFRLLYRGGEEFLAAAGQSASRHGRSGGLDVGADLLGIRGRRRRFLHQLEGEPDTKFFSRWERAFIVGYFPAIIDYFRYWEFSTTPLIRPQADKQDPGWLDPFLRDASGGGCSFTDFVRNVFLDSLLVRRAGWLIGSPTNTADSSDSGVVSLTPYSAEQIIDWDEDEYGELLWVVLRRTDQSRAFPNQRTQIETYTYLDRVQWQAWVVEYGSDAKARDLRPVAGNQHSLGVVPFVRLDVPHGLWMGNKLRSWAIDMFNQMSMLSYGKLTSAFLQPYLKTNEVGSGERIFGEGVLLNLRAGTEHDNPEEFGWASPSVEPLKFVADQLKEQRDEGYRIVHQMSLAIDSGAVGAIARSGVSKIEDRRASEIILGAYGGYIRDAMIRTLDMLSLIYGDSGIEWSVDGFDTFRVSGIDEDLQNAALWQSLGVQSPTAKAEIHKNITLGPILRHADVVVRNKIAEEIDAAAGGEKLEAEAAPAALTEESAVAEKV